MPEVPCAPPESVERNKSSHTEKKIRKISKVKIKKISSPTVLKVEAKKQAVMLQEKEQLEGNIDQLCPFQCRLHDGID